MPHLSLDFSSFATRRSQAKLHRCNHLVRRTWPKRRIHAFKYCVSFWNVVPAAGIERYTTTDNTQLIENLRTQEPHNPLYARLLCTKSCTTKSGAILDNLGSVTAIRGFCREVSEHSGVVVEFDSGDVPAPLPSEMSLSLFRVVQEAVHNAVKYSGQKHLHVSLQA